ncbi:MAG: guanylate kinase [Anaerolineales bacterium]|nr:guanylate kinase [Anaerolineales bacterium]MBS3752153.1 guanylate kinase [Anaerolineales bacterium]
MSDFPSNRFHPNPPDPLLIVISGPSGVGKDSVIAELKERDLPLHFVITATSRPPRPDEEHGVDYFFVSEVEFEEMIERGDLLEYAVVYDQYKGIPKAQVRKGLESGKHVVMRVDVQGAETVRNLVPDALLIFLTAQNEEELVSRLKNRETEDDESLKIRLQTVRQELKQMEWFDYVVINREGELDETVDVIEAIIEAEQHRVDPRSVEL